LDFFHSLFGFGRGGEVGGVDPWADPAASSRDLFFPAPVFMLFDGEDFILQMHQFSLASARGLLRRQAAAARVDLQLKVRWQCARVADSWLDLFQMAVNVEDGKT
jgi:hypothetical protein